MALCLAAALPARAQPARAGAVVSSVELHVPPGIDPEGLPGLITVAKGQPLSRRGVRESIGRLWRTNRFSDVVVWTTKAGGGVRVVFEVKMKRCVEILGVEDNHALDAQTIKDASGLKERDHGTKRCPSEGEYYDERLRRASERVKALYRQHGYYSADVALESFEQSDGIVLVLRVTEGPPTRLAGVSFAGDPGMSLPELLRIAGVEVGGVLDWTRLEKGLEALKEVFRRGGYYRARIGEPQLERNGDVATLSVPVDAGPKFAFVFRGNRSFPAALLRGVLNYDGSETLDPVRLERRLTAFYRYHGFADATIRASELPSPDGASAEVAFDIQEGRVLQVSGVSATGDPAIVSVGELREAVIAYVRSQVPDLSPTTRMQGDPLALEGRTQRSSAGAPLPDPESVLIEEAFTRVADWATEKYRNRGYLGAQVNVVVDRDLVANRAKVRFEVQEGPMTLIAEETVVGEPPGLSIQEMVGVDPNAKKPLNAGKVEEDRRAILRKLTANGYLFAAVQSVTSIENDGHTGKVLFRVDPGPQVRVGEILFPDDVRSGEEVFRANLQVREGELLDPDQLVQSQRNLTLTGAYRQVSVRLIDPEIRSDKKDVEVRVRERARYDGETGFGFSLAEGPRLLLDADAPNLGGHGLNLAARGRLNYFGASAMVLFPAKNTDLRDLLLLNGLGGRGNVSATYPLYALLPAKIRARGDLVAERQLRPAYWFTRFAAIAGLDWTAPPLLASLRSDERRFDDWLTANLQYELEHDRVAIPNTVLRVARYDPTHLNERFEPGIYTLQNLRSSLNLRVPFPGFYPDYREDPANFDHGVVLSGLGELTRDFKLRDPYFTFKAAGNLSVYVSFAKRWGLALSGRAGRIFHLATGGRAPRNTIIPKRFFLGGYATMRGFGEDALLTDDRREALHQSVSNCQALVSHAGCSTEVLDVLRGGVPVSDGGDLFGVAKAELRLPSGIGGIDLGLFFEAGNLWVAAPDLTQMNVDSMRYVAGVGLRYPTLIGPVALDVGFNLRPDKLLNEPIANVHFNIGLF